MLPVDVTWPCERHASKRGFCPKCNCCKGCPCICSTSCDARHADPKNKSILTPLKVSYWWWIHLIEAYLNEKKLIIFKKQGETSTTTTRPTLEWQAKSENKIIPYTNTNIRSELVELYKVLSIKEGDISKRAWERNV